MPLIDLKCTSSPCAHTFEYQRPLAEWPATPPCSKCASPTIQMLFPSGRSTVEAIIVFQAPDGSFRFPGDAAGSQAARYQREGYTRLELRGAADVRRFETVMNKHEYSRAARRVEAKQQQRELRESHTRSALRNLMPRMTIFGRELAREAMRRNDAKPRESVKDANFHAEVYSYDRSNREGSRDAQGRRRRD